MSHRLPVVAIVGRPNVGKSTFFNRILGRNQAIVHDRPGVTRDRNFARVDWAGTSFFLVDTGGVVEGSDEPFDVLVREQVLTALGEADLVLFLVDGKEGIHPLDERLSNLVRESAKPVLLVVNKLDNLPEDLGRHDFWRLGMGEPLPVSSATGKRTGDMLDQIVALLPPPAETPADADVRVAVLGRPNVGKSSFVNRLFGEERVVVSEVPGTTRDPIDSTFQYHGKQLVFVDTAGLRRQSKVDDSIEYYSTLRTHQVIREADVCLVLMDGQEEVTQQDLKVIEEAWEAGCGVVLGVNKWDLVEKDHATATAFEKTIRGRAPFLEAVPFLFLSALTGQRVRKSLDVFLEVADERQKKIATPEVNRVLGDLVKEQPPPHSRGRPVRLRYATQTGTGPPSFVIFSNLPREVPRTYVRYLEHGFRAAWGFHGAPIRVSFRSSRAEEERR